MNFYLKMKQDQEKLLENIVSLMENDDSFDAPADAVKWSKNLFLTRTAVVRPTFVQKISAILQMDLSPNKAAFGERSASASSARQMLFGAGDHSIDLRITKSGKTFNINGQILGENFAESEIKLANAEKTFTAKANEMSEFKFEKVAAGNYDLSLVKNELEIVIENIEIN